MKKVALVTVTFNSEKETHDVLESLRSVRTEGFTFSVIVVDNASVVPFTLTKEEKKQQVLLIATKENLGFAGGYNVGIAKALEKDADFVVVINNDTIVDPNFIHRFLETFEMHADCGIVVPKIYFAKGHEFHKERYKENEKGNVLWYAGGFMDWKNVFSKHRGVDEVDHGQYNREEKMDFATGCCMCIPRKVLEKVGFFDEELFLYFEDADLSQRILRAGFVLYYNPKAVIWHVNAASSEGSGSSLHDYFLTRNRMLFGMRYAPIRSKFALIRESIRLFFSGRKWQRKGIEDFYLHKFGKGRYPI